MKTLPDLELQSTSVTKRNTAFLLDTILHSAPCALLKKNLLELMVDSKGAFPPIDLAGLQGSLSSILAAALFNDQKGSLMVLCGQNSFERYENDFDALLPKERICNTSDELSLSIGAILQKEKRVVLTFFDDLEVSLCKPPEAESRIFRLKTEHDAGYETLKRFLLGNGF